MSDADLKALLRESYEELKRSKARLAALEERLHEPLAILSMACRFPGGADRPEALFHLLWSGTSTIGNPPAHRASAGSATGAVGAYLDDIELFDPAFFGMSLEEARLVDPQQRLLLEVAWEALERAGITRAQVRGKRVGVFVGASASDYGEQIRRLRPEPHAVLGSVLSALPGRLSYFLGLTGPSLTIDAGCASSLVAIHFAAQALRRGECDLAFAGGVNVVLDGSGAAILGKMGLHSPTGRCRPFDTSADGYVRGEGCGLVLLTRLGDARRDALPPLALLRGSATNHVGASNGMATPNGPAQEAVVKQALHDARLAPAEVSYVECHGTGTRNGDAIEAQALASAYASAARTSRPLLVGSAKWSLGHGESAASIASVMKAIACLQRKQIPACPVGTPSAAIPWDEFSMKPVSTHTPWGDAKAPLRAGVHAYSMTGANAHIILEEAPAPPALPPVAQPPSIASPLPILLSAHTDEALVAQARRLLEYIEPLPDSALADVAFSLATTRTHLDHRLALQANDKRSLTKALRQAIDARDTSLGASVCRGVVEPLPAVAFFFPGEALTASTTLFTGHPGIQEIFATIARRFPSPFTGTTSLFLIELTLSTFFQRLGVVPYVALGEGIGAIAAACISGACGEGEAFELAEAYSKATENPPQREAVERLRRLVRSLPFRSPTLPLACAATGRWLDAHELASETFWADQLQRARPPLRELPMVEGATAFLALGPSAARRPNKEQSALPWLSAGSEQPAGWVATLGALLGLHAHGVEVNWAPLFAPFGGQRVALPTYAWQRQRCWVDVRPAKDQG